MDRGANLMGMFPSEGISSELHPGPSWCFPLDYQSPGQSLTPCFGNKIRGLFDWRALPGSDR
jgi:hypothetical protein